MNVDDVTVVEGDQVFDTPCVILTVGFARLALENGSTDEAIETGLNALDLSGKRFVILDLPQA